MGERFLKFLKRVVKILAPILDRLEKYSVVSSLALVLIAVFTTIAGTWLIWDWQNTLSHFLNWEAMDKGFKFPAPFFLYTWTAKEWTAPFDLGLTLIGIGSAAGIIGGFLLCLSMVKRRKN